MKRMRERAQAAGLCLRCCKNPPKAQRSMCDPCLAATRQRAFRMRERQKDARHRTIVARKYEAEGDAIKGRSRAVRAVAKFETALSQMPAIEDEIRLCEKIGQVFYKSARPDYAIAWFERVRERF